MLPKCPISVSSPRATVRLHDAPVDQTLNDGHLRLLELLLGITAGGVGEVYGVADLDVVGEGDVLDLDTAIERTRRGGPCRSARLVRHCQYTEEARTPGCPTCRTA